MMFAAIEFAIFGYLRHHNGCCVLDCLHFFVCHDRLLLATRNIKIILTWLRIIRNFFVSATLRKAQYADPHNHSMFNIYTSEFGKRVKISIPAFIKLCQNKF